MTLIHLLQRFAAATSARDSASLVVLAAALGAAVFASRRAPTALKRHRLALASLGLGSCLLLAAPHGVVSISISTVAAGVVVLGLVLHARADRPGDDDPEADLPMRTYQVVTWCAVAACVMVIFLVTDLGGYAGRLMVWEPEAMSGLVKASEDGTGFLEFVAQRLQWDDGVISASHHSLLYGSGTYALWLLFGASTVTLRLMSAIFALACLPVAFVVGTRIGDRRIATAAVVVLSLNPVLLFYGRYGISITGSLFAVLLLLLACERLTDPDENHWWLGPAVAAAAFVATLGYSPTRVVTTTLVAITLFYGASRWGQTSRGRRFAVASVVVVLVAVWLAQAASGSARAFVAARGEQLFTLHTKPEMLYEVLGDSVDPEHLTLSQRLAVGRFLVARTVPDLGVALSFCVRPMESAWHVIRRDPPDLPLIQGPLLLFAVWGLVRSIFTWRCRWPILLVGVALAATLPLLLTTRTDIHRLSPAALPVVLWTALGIGTAHRVAVACGVPGAARTAVAALMLALLTASNSTFLFFPDPPHQSELAVGVASEIENISEPLVIGLDCGPSDEGEILIALCNREWRDHARHWELLPNEMVASLKDERGTRHRAIALIEGMRYRATVLLAPRESFAEAARVLSERGSWVRSFGTQLTGWWRIDLIPDPRFQARAGTGAVASPKSQKTPFADGSARALMPLGYRNLRDVRYSFKAPRFDASYDGRPITMGGVTFDLGIGMHAWTSMRFEVPAGAVALESVIGVSDTVASCDDALVTFEVWNDRGSRIYDSGPVSGGAPPQRIRVPLRGTSTVDLVLTEGGNGRDCDHGNWAEPVFILEK